MRAATPLTVKVLPCTEHIPTYTPQPETEGAAGFDFRADIQAEIMLAPGERVLITTGLKFAIPVGYELQVRPRSGLALKNGITVVNTPGTVDADYRGVVGVILLNTGLEPFRVEPGMRIAQGVVNELPSVRYLTCATPDELGSTARDSGGFGSTGT